MIAPATSGMSSHPVRYSRCAKSSAATPVAASSPYSDPPARQIACTHSNAAPSVPGEPPRTSICTAAPAGKWKTEQPVGPSSYSAHPISRPGEVERELRPVERGSWNEIEEVVRDPRHRRESTRSGSRRYFSWITDRMFPAGSLNQAMFGPSPVRSPKKMPRSSVFRPSSS